MIASASGRFFCATAHAAPYQACGEGVLLDHDGRQFFDFFRSGVSGKGRARSPSETVATDRKLRTIPWPEKGLTD